MLNDAYELISATQSRTNLFWLTEVSERNRRTDGQLYYSLTLDNSEGRFYGMVWPECSVEVERQRIGSVVEVYGQRRSLADRQIIDIQSAHNASVEDVSNGAAILPRHLCPERATAALDRLVEFNASIEPDLLREFLTRVLLDKRVAQNLLMCPAAQSYHHAFDGGLLVHSTEMLDLVGMLARQGMPSCHSGVAITQIGYFLHDIGKLITMCGETSTKKLVRHEFMNGVLLGPHLHWLEGRWPEAAVALTYILDFLSRPAAGRGFAKWLGADIVAWADQLSTAASRGAGIAQFDLSNRPAGEVVSWENLDV